jgi:RND family efflux transporter MFP subunit
LTSKVGVLAAGCATVVVLGLCGCNRTPAAATGKAGAITPKVTVVVARKRDVPVIRSPNATTRALREVTIRARVKGFLKEKHFDEGSNVTENQLLLVIDEEPFKVNVAQAKAALEEANAELRKAQESKAREVAKAQVAIAETTLQLERVEERRERLLLTRKAASQEDYDRAKAKADASVAQVQAATASRDQAVADYDINILAARAKVDKATADLKEAEIELGYCRMSSPFEGRAGELQVKLGNLVGPGTGSADTTALLTVQQLHPMGLDIRPASVYLPTIMQLVKSGLDLTLRVEGQRAHRYRGKINFVDNMIDPTTSTVLVKAEVPNPDQTILPGEYVKVDLTIGDYAGAIVIPAEAVVEAQEGSRVLVVDPDNKVRAVVVKPLDHYQGLVVLSSGLEDGQRVVVRGIQLVRPGQTVQAEEVSVDSFLRTDSSAESKSPMDSPLLKIRGGEAAGQPKGTETPSSPPQTKPVP